MEILLAAIVLLALRGSASAATPPKQQQQGGGAGGPDTTAKDVIGATTAAIPLVVSGVGAIASLFGGGATAAAGTAAAAGGASGAAAAAGGGGEATAAATGGVAATVAANIAIAAVVIAIGAAFLASVGPLLASLYQSAAEWARKRAYGKEGVLASMDLQALGIEQQFCTALLHEVGGPNVLRCAFKADPAASHINGSYQDRPPQIQSVLATVDFEQQRTIARLSRCFAIQQLYAKNKAISNFFTITRGQDDAANEANGVALSDASFVAWAEAYCNDRRWTSWGLNLGPTNDPEEWTWGGLNRSTAAGLGPGWPLALARLTFLGKAAGAAMCHGSGFGVQSAIGPSIAVDLLNLDCGLAWIRRGYWLVDPATNGAFNPIDTLQFGGDPRVMDAHRIDSAGNVFLPDAAHAAIVLASLNPPVDQWL